MLDRAIKLKSSLAAFLIVYLTAFFSSSLLIFDTQKYDGYPSGSMVDFACDANGCPILAVSDLAVHSKVFFLSIFYFILFFFPQSLLLKNDKYKKFKD